MSSRISSQRNKWLFGFCFIVLVILLSQATSADKNSAEASELNKTLPPPPPPPPEEHPVQQMNNELDEIIEILDKDGIAK